MGEFVVKRRELTLYLASGLCLFIFGADLLWMLVYSGQLDASEEDIRTAVFTANIVIQLLCFFLLLLTKVMNYSGLCVLITLPCVLLAVAVKAARLYLFAVWKLEEETGVPMEIVVALILLFLTLVLTAMEIYLIITDRPNLRNCNEPEDIWCCFCTLEEYTMGCDEIKDICCCKRKKGQIDQILMEHDLKSTVVVDLSRPREYWTRRGSIDPIAMVKQMDRYALSSTCSSRRNSSIAESDILPLLPNTNIEINANIYTCKADIVTGKIYFNDPFVALLDLHSDRTIQDTWDLCGSVINCKCVNTDSKKLQTTKDYIGRCLPDHAIKFEGISDLELTQFYSANSERFLKRQAIAEDLCRTFFDYSDKLRKCRPHIKVQPVFLAHLPDPQLEFLALEQKLTKTERLQILGPDGYPDLTEKRVGSKYREFVLKVFALVHWSYSKFKEEAIICDIRGVDNYITHLTLSCEKRSHVRPEEANRECVENFKKTHQCNRYCRMAELTEFARPAESTPRIGKSPLIHKPKFSTSTPISRVSRLTVNRNATYKSPSPRPTHSARPTHSPRLTPSPRPTRPAPSPRPSAVLRKYNVAPSRTGKASPLKRTSWPWSGVPQRKKAGKIGALTPRSLIKVTEAEASSTIDSQRK